LKSPSPPKTPSPPSITGTRGCIVGRGVLIDYKAYIESTGVTYHPLDGHRITVSEIETIAVH
jgi:hypothetical protein